MTQTKTRQTINREYYQRNQKRLQNHRKENYQQKKEQELNNYYSAHSIKVLLTLKEYTELNQQTRKLWLDFAATLHDLTKNGISDIIQIQQLELLAVQLRQGYYTAGKQESKKLASSWNTLEPEEEAKLIKFWGREKARKAKRLTTALTELEEQGLSYEKEIERAKFHEEKGKVNCECWHCQQRQEIRAEIKEQHRKELEEIYDEQLEEKIECGECGKLVKESQWDDENDLCKKCVKKFAD